MSRSKRPAHLSDLPAEAFGGQHLSSTRPHQPLCLPLLRRFLTPPPLVGAGEQGRRFCGRAASPGLGVYMNIPADKQATSLISYLPLGKAPVACSLENAKALSAVVQVKPVSLSFAGTPQLSLVLQCFRVEILDIYSGLRA